MRKREEQRVTKRMSIHMSDSHSTDKYSRLAKSTHHTHSHKGVNALIAVYCYHDVSVPVTG